MDTLGSFSILWTGDGSPSLRGLTEPMHHLGGAYSETQYIYGEALRKAACWDVQHPWRVLIVGLGLGYIELLATAEAILHRKELALLTYEIDGTLVDSFLDWLKGRELEVYDRLYEYFKTEYPNLPIKETLLDAHKSGHWNIQGALTKDSLPLEPYNILLFDAFSGKSTPDLWTEEFLGEFLTSVAKNSAVTIPRSASVFATYACTGVLRRSLQTAGYQVEKRLGFQGKRNSTLALRAQ